MKHETYTETGKVIYQNKIFVGAAKIFIFLPRTGTFHVSVQVSKTILEMKGNMGCLIFLSHIININDLYIMCRAFSINFL